MIVEATTAGHVAVLLDGESTRAAAHLRAGRGGRAGAAADERAAYERAQLRDRSWSLRARSPGVVARAIGGRGAGRCQRRHLEHPAAADMAAPAVERLDETAVAALLSASALAASLLPAADSSPVEAEVAPALSSYRVPRLGDADGGCGVGLEPEPFCVLDALRQLPRFEDAATALRRLRRLRGACEALAAATGAQWVGVYESTPTPDAAEAGARQLLKLAYVGAPSRAYFPLTEAFAAGSNNSTSVLRRQAIVIHDVRRMGGDTPYYTCDGKVRSEVCAPIMAPSGECIGLIDCESWSADNFSVERVAAILRLAAQLGAADLLR